MNLKRPIMFTAMLLACIAVSFSATAGASSSQHKTQMNFYAKGARHCGMSFRNFGYGFYNFKNAFWGFAKNYHRPFIGMWSYGYGAMKPGKQHTKKGEYLPGDFHQHTLYTDGSNPFFDVMDENAAFGLEWWANSEHGGSRNRDGEGDKWLDTDKYPENPILGDNPEAGYMYRWQSLRDYVYPNILETRGTYCDKTVISGVEWNVPGHEHCSTAFYNYDGSANAVSEFEFRFDKSDKDTSRVGEESLINGFGSLSKTNSSKDDAILAVEWAQAGYEQGVFDSWIVPAHIERARSYNIEDFRNWHNAGPDVMQGFEGAPGHQTSGDRGFGRSSYGEGTYGGSGVFSAVVGGLWDALLGEGRVFTNFASSDFHNHWSDGGSDFWPGEYQKNYTFIESTKCDPIKAIFDGVRSGNSWHVEGDLIDQLAFTATCRNQTATMGESITCRAGDWVHIMIKAHDPLGANNCPLDMDNPSLAQIGISQPLAMPVLDHIDLISGEVTGLIDPSSPEYTEDVNPSTGIIATFDNYKNDEEMVVVYKFRAEESRYFRLRGTNLPAGVPFETDADGNPLADSEANDNIYSGDVTAGNGISEETLTNALMPGITTPATSKLDDVAEAYADLWFYSNALFVNVK